MAVVVAAAVAIFVVTKIRLAVSSVSSPVIETVEQPLKPNHANQRMNTPSAASVRLWPGIAFTVPSSSYLPMRAPRIFAPISAQTPPTMCTAVEPAKSWKPISASQPPPQIQWPLTG